MYIVRTKIKATTPFGFELISRKYSENRSMLEGKFESSELGIIRECLNEADVFVDIGANIGYYVCLALSLGKHAIAVEPQQQNLECLYANLSTNGWTHAEVYPVGLSDKPGLLTLYGASGLCASLVKGWAGYSERFKQIIPVTTMDNILGYRFEGKKLFIKVDVEGAEFDVLRGASKTLRMIPQPTWLIEVSSSLFHPNGVNRNFTNTFDIFWKNNYEVRSGDVYKRLVTMADIQHPGAYGGASQEVFNYIFIPKE